MNRLSTSRQVQAGLALVEGRFINVTSRQTYEDARAPVGNNLVGRPLEALGFQQHAGDVIMLRSVADEEIDLRHEALEHFGGL